MFGYTGTYDKVAPQVFSNLEFKKYLGTVYSNLSLYINNMNNSYVLSRMPNFIFQIRI